MPDRTAQCVDHGFHAFFRQYYNWRSILRRVDPDETLLAPVDGYPVINAAWPVEDFSALPAGPPLNALWLLLRSPSVRLRDLRHADRRLAVHMLTFDPVRTFEEFDDMSADQFLDRLVLPDRARAMLFDVFAHAFFNRPEELSAAELLAMFHFYFLGNSEGLGFDAPRADYQSAIWTPLGSYLEQRQAVIDTDTTVTRIEPSADGGWTVHDASGRAYAGDYVVLALPAPALRDLVAASPALRSSAPVLTRQVAQFDSGPPYAVARFWLDGDVAHDRAAFSSMSGQPTLDSVTLYHRLDSAAAQWAARTRGSVVELHAYAAPDGLGADEAARRMRNELAVLWPETAMLNTVDVRACVAADAPAFAPGSHRERPTVRTDADGLYLAGDGIRSDVLGALMERAATTGITAANEILEREGARIEPLWSVRPRGLLARHST